tara:strand:- start:3609 stop:3827 length:219 start_codon:yes stop_codon:yes gene_type:complete
MTKLFDKAIEQARHLPDARQDEAAEILLSLAAQEADDALRLSPEQVEEVNRRQVAPIYATDAEVSAFFTRFA